MFTLDINKRILKRIALYSAATVFLIVFDYIYSIFGHGVTSKYMSMAFLYPLIGGVVFYSAMCRIIESVLDKENCQMFFSFYNAGIATLAIGSIMKGIMNIAGTDSPYLIYYTVIGWMLVILGITVLIVLSIKKNK